MQYNSLKMKKFFYSLIISTFLVSAVWAISPTDTYAAHCPPGQTHLLNLPKDAQGRSGCGVPPQGPTVSEVTRTILSFGKCALSPFDCAAIAILGLTGYLLYGAGVVLNFAVTVTILDMSSFIKNIDTIDIAWRTFRDLANIFFIFVLIYISVSTILGLSSGATKQKLATVVVVALLINFSLFFTKAIIDASNIVTIQFYNAIAPGEDPLDSGLSGIFMDSLKVVSIFNTKPKTATGYYDTALDSVDGLANPFTVATMGSLFFLIAAFVFLAAAILLTTRFVILIFLMIMSPLAYVGMILPKGEGMSKRWWDSLIDQCLFAPVLMMFLWVTASIINHPSFTTMISRDNQTGSFVSAIAENAPSNVWIIFNFMVIISLLIASLIAAKKAGAAGSGFATKLAAGATMGGAAWLGRHSLGRLGNTIANSGYAKNMAARGGAAGLYGRTLKGGAQKVAKSGFDLRKAGFGGATLGGMAKDAGLSSLGDIGAGKGGYEAVLNKQVKKETERAKGLGTEPVFTRTKTKEEYESHQEKVKELKGKIGQIEKDLENVNANGVNLGETIRLSGERSAVETQIKTSEAKIKEIEENQGVIFNPKETYGTNLGNRRGITTPWKVPRKNKEAASVILGKTKANEENKKEGGNEEIMDTLRKLEDKVDDMQDDIKDKH